MKLIVALILIAGVARTAQGACQKAIMFAVAESGGLAYRLPNVSIKWFEKTEKKFFGVCFSQLGTHANSGDKHYLVVISTSRTAFDGLLPVFSTNTSRDTTPVSGSGTVTDNYGSTWNYTYDGSVTKTTRTTTQTNMPYTDTTTGLYANAYNETGTLIGAAEKSATFRQGGDAANTLGYNLASRLLSVNIGERLLENVVKQISTLPSAKDEAGIRVASAKKEEMANQGGPPVSDGILGIMEDQRRYLSLHPDDVKAKDSWSSFADIYCQANPDGSYVDLEGGSKSCGGMAKWAFNQMEQFRHEIAEFGGKDDAWAKMGIEVAKSGWSNVRKIYCDKVPDGVYIDLDAKGQSCRSK